MWSFTTSREKTKKNMFLAVLPQAACSSPKRQNANVEVLLPCQGELKKELIILEDVEVHC